MNWFKRHKNKSNNKAHVIDIRIEQQEAYLQSYVNRADLVLDEVGEIGKQLEALSISAIPSVTSKEFLEFFIRNSHEAQFLYFCSYRLLDELVSLIGLIRVTSASLEILYNKFNNRTGLERLNTLRSFTTEVESQVVNSRETMGILFADISVQQMEANIQRISVE